MSQVLKGETGPSPSKDFVPALLVIDVQEDFLPPNGSLAVPNGREIIPVIQELLTQPFAVKIATKDWHPANHVSFASNHADVPPYTPITLTNPLNNSESMTSTAWPIHCVQHTAGAEFPAELLSTTPDAQGRDVPSALMKHAEKVFYKGQNARLETYSAFYDSFERPRVLGNELGEYLAQRGVTDVFVVGLAADYCVRATALHAVAEGFRVWVVQEATRPVDAQGWEDCKKGMEGMNIGFCAVDGPEIRRIKGLGK